MDSLPPTLSEKASRRLADFRERADPAVLPMLDHGEIAAALPKVFAFSDFVADSCVREPALLFSLVETGDLLADSGAVYYAQRLREAVAGVADEAGLYRLLRRFRRREMVRIAWRDLARWAELDETLADLSFLAESCLRTALDFLYGNACQRWGTPQDSGGRPQNLVVLGMGKLGGGELNFSSDIDLIFAYGEAGTLPDPRQTSYQEFFTKLAQSLVKALDLSTEDGFVFRVDTRLRPFGDSGPLVMNADAMEAYYQGQAREWERYAMIKARPVAGDAVTAGELMAMLKPFVYRRYLDYRAIGELRDMKAKIVQELKRKDRSESVKLGMGGIREIEFIGQAFQLIRGGQDPSLQDRRIRHVLDVLAERGYLPAQEADRLQTCYRFLRLTENRLQELADRQTHELSKDEGQRLCLAVSMGFADWASFKAALDRVCGAVHAVFQQVIEPARDESGAALARRVWAGGLDLEARAALLRDMGYTNPDEAAELLAELRASPAVARLTARGAAELDRLMPQVVATVASANDPQRALLRVIALLEAVASRNVYYTLLAENPAVLAQLVRLADSSPWIAALLARHPILLDGLLDPRQLYAPQKKEDLRRELARQQAGVDRDDQEAFMNRLRQFKQAQVLRVAAADVMDAIPLMVVSDYLTDIAEVVVEAALDEAWRHAAAKHGVPPGCCSDAVGNFVIVAYGKLGGIELGYGSDLDLVFLYDAERPEAATDGSRPITAAQFYARVVQRMIHVLTTNMLSGKAYEVDLRLRPSGNSGLLVTSLAAFSAYQAESAWTWEHQALVRARCIAGDPLLAEKYRRVRAQTLARARDEVALQKEVREMRGKMREHLAAKEADVFDLKQGFGGIADIEFIVQLGVLARAASYPALLDCTDNVRLLERLGDAGFLSREDAEFLKQAYLRFRAGVHRAALQEREARVPADELAVERAGVQAIWRRVMAG